MSAFVAAKEPSDVTELLSLELEADKTIQQLLDGPTASMGEDRDPPLRAVRGRLRHRVSAQHDPALPPSVGALVELDGENEEVGKNVASTSRRCPRCTCRARTSPRMSSPTSGALPRRPPA